MKNITTRDRASSALQITVVILAASLVLAIGGHLAGDDPLARQTVAWVANVAMLVTIWMGLRIRGQGWDHLGVGFRFGGWGALLRTILQSLAVLAAALGAFVAGAVLMSSFPSGPAAASADMSGYQYLHGNLPMLLLALAAVYVASSFGEEVVYRGFLMTRLAEIGCGTRIAWGVAVVASAVVFGLAHFSWGITGVVQTTLMGLALAASYLLVRRNLWSLVLAHAWMDTMLLVQLYLGPHSART